MTLWSMARSPLIMGGNLLELDDWTRSLLTNEEVLAVNQHSKENRQALKDGGLIVWTARPESGDGYYIAAFNTGDSPQDVERSWRDLGMKQNAYRIRDLWERKNKNGAYQLKATLPPHASVMWKLYQ